MTDLVPLLPGRPVPALEVPLVGGGTWSMAMAKGDPFTVVIGYRGVHCPKCNSYLNTVQDQLAEFDSRGIEVVAVSTDPLDRAERAVSEWGIGQLQVGYDLPLAVARQWGLFISQKHGEKEPQHFAEPGLFVVRADKTLYASFVQTVPFARPPIAELLGALDFVTANSYPARGTVESLVA